MVHNVYFWLNSDADIPTFEAKARDLTEIDVVQRGSIGKSAGTAERPVTDKTFSYHLSLEFASIDDHNIYQDHAVHHAFVDACKPMFDRVIVYDSEAI